MLTIIVAAGVARSVVSLILGGRTRAVGFTCALLSLAVTPLLIGNVSYAFLFNGWLRSTTGALGLGVPHTAEGVIFLVGIAGGLRYAPLLAWLLTISTLWVDPKKRAFGNIIGMSAQDFIRAELIWPWAVISVLVGAFSFQDAATDYMVSYLVLRPSPATSTELLAHYSSRSFLSFLTSRSGLDAIRAVTIQSAVAATAFLLAFVAQAGGVLLLARQGRWQLVSSSRRQFSATHPTLFPLLIVAAFAALTLVPPVDGLLRLSISFSTIDRELLNTFAFAGTVSALGSTISAGAMYLLRESTRIDDGSAGRRFGLVGVLASATGFLPPLGLAVATYGLLFFVMQQYSGGANALVGWMAAQLLKLLPLQCLFLIPSLLGVADDRIRYLKDAGVALPSRLWHIYLRPNLVAHGALVLLGWNLVINEGLINAAFQANLPSYAELVTRATSGRSAAYGAASALIAVQALIFASMCALWGRQTFRSWRARNDLG